MTTLALPGLIDAHVHLREPGATQKEDVLSGTRAALAGGVVAVLDMPNNAPPIVSREALAAKLAIVQRKAVCDYALFVGYAGHDLPATLAAAPDAVGLKLYLDETFGHLTLAAPASLAEVFERWPGPGPIAVHAESHSIRVALDLAARYRQALHVCHVPDPDDLLAIDAARQAGTRVTCEVTPHHLFLNSSSAHSLGAYGQMKPPLVTPRKVAQFWERLPLVDAIASDHAPHTRAEKDSATPPPGVPGLETTLPLLLRAVDRRRLTVERLVQLTWSGPLRIYGLEAPADAGVEVDMGAPYTLPASGYQTRCGWSPFAGQEALGHVARVWLRGRTVWERGSCRVEPGYGQRLRASGPPSITKEAETDGSEQ